MAGMFYSMQEAAGKLKISPEQLQQLVTDGRLRGFKDGANMLFKVDEVDALHASGAPIPVAETPAEQAPVEVAEQAPVEVPTEEIPVETPDEEEAIVLEVVDDGLVAEPEPIAEVEPVAEPEPIMEAEPVVEAEPVAEPEPVAEVEPVAEPEPVIEPETIIEAEPVVEAEPVAEPEPVEEIELVAEPEPFADSGSGILSLDSEGSGETPQSDTNELLGLDSFSGLDSLEGSGDADQGTDDTLSGLIDGTSDEPSLEDIEEDVNLDTFGSGSGLLDLSLQADDTSLGGILDEIYTAEGEQETSETPALGMEEEEGAPAPMMPVEEDMEQVAEVAPVAAAVAVEIAPDAVSNAMGWMMILPLVVVVITAVVAISGNGGFTTGLLGGLQSFGAPGGIHIIWYVMIGAAVLSGGIVGGAAMVGGGEKKPKKPKEPKPKKEKKPKKIKEKKPKKVKEKKEKKPKKEKKKKK